MVEVQQQEPLSPAANMDWLAVLQRARHAEELRSRLAELWPALKAGKPETIAILGAASEGVRLAALCRAAGIGVSLIADDNPERVGTEIEGQLVQPTARLSELDRSVPLVIASHRVLSATKRFRGEGFETVVPFAALQLLDPSAYPPHMFYDGLLEDLFVNRDRYLKLSEGLADDLSCAVLDAAIGFRLTMDPGVFESVLEPELYNADCVRPLSDDEVYIDGGAFDGDSIEIFMQQVEGKFGRVFAFEPDPETFARLSARFADDDRISPIAKGLSNGPAVLRFQNDGSRGSLLSDTGSLAVEVTGIDHELAGEKVSYIKMNIEGAELDALDGAKETIRRDAPKLAVSAYHHPAHLWQVPAKALELRDDYDLYFRQHDGGIIETVLYAVPSK